MTPNEQQPAQVEQRHRDLLAQLEKVTAYAAELDNSQEKELAALRTQLATSFDDRLKGRNKSEDPSLWLFTKEEFDLAGIAVKTLEEKLATAEAALREARKDGERLDWLDHHCSFVADEPYKIGPYRIGQLRNMADDGIAIDAAMRPEETKT